MEREDKIRTAVSLIIIGVIFLGVFFFVKPPEYEKTTSVKCINTTLEVQGLYGIELVNKSICYGAKPQLPSNQMPDDLTGYRNTS